MGKSIRETEFITMIGDALQKPPENSNAPSLEENSQADNPVLDTITTEISTELHDYNYHNTILSLMQDRDERNGIHWQWLDTTQNTPLKTLIRDARGQNSDPTEAYEGYAILLIQYVRACLALLDNHASAEIKNTLHKHLITALDALKNARDLETIKATFREHSKEIVMAYVVLHNESYPTNQINRAEAKKRIGIAKDFVILDEPSFHVATLTTVIDDDSNPHTILEGDIAHYALTDTQKKRFNNLSNETWFINLPAWQQALTEKFAPKIVEENRVIPTQLRFLPGIRNSYRRVIQVDIDKPKEKRSNPQSFFRCGTILTFVKKYKNTILKKEKPDEEQRNLTNENAAQLKLNANPSKDATAPIHFITLNAAQNKFNNDSTIVQLSDDAIQALDDNQSTHSNACVNAMRRTEKSDYTGIEAQLAQVAQHIQNTNHSLNEQYRLEEDLKSKLCAYLTRSGSHALLAYTTPGSLANRFIHLMSGYTLWNSGNDKDTVQSRLKASHPELWQLIETAIACRATINSFHRLDLDRNNHNLQIAAYSHLLSQQLRTLGLSDSENISACQSGKDRNGFVAFLTSVYHTCQTLFGKLKGNLTNVARQFARSGHTQFMANMTGFGCFGVKKDSKGAVPEEWGDDIKNLLVLDTASYNKEPKIEKNKQERKEVHKNNPKKNSKFSSKAIIGISVLTITAISIGIGLLSIMMPVLFPIAAAYITATVPSNILHIATIASISTLATAVGMGAVLLTKMLFEKCCGSKNNLPVCPTPVTNTNIHDKDPSLPEMPQYQEIIFSSPLGPHPQYNQDETPSEKYNASNDYSHPPTIGCYSDDDTSDDSFFSDSEDFSTLSEPEFQSKGAGDLLTEMPQASPPKQKDRCNIL